MDPRAAQARGYHRKITEAAEESARHRYTRDQLILALRRDDPARWTYAALAQAVGCSTELIAKICTR